MPCRNHQIETVMIETVMKRWAWITMTGGARGTDAAIRLEEVEVEEEEGVVDEEDRLERRGHGKEAGVMHCFV